MLVKNHSCPLLQFRERVDTVLVLVDKLPQTGDVGSDELRVAFSNALFKFRDECFTVGKRS